MIKLRNFICASFFATALIGCNALRYVPSDEVIYTGATINTTIPPAVKETRQVKEELLTLLEPIPNMKFLGVRWGLLAYYKTENGKGGPFYKFLNKQLAEKPVYLSDVDVQWTEKLITNRLENHGYFSNDLVSTEYIKEKTANLTYNVRTKVPLTMLSYQLNRDTLPIYDDLQKAMEDTKIVTGSKFDLGLLNEERARIDAYMKANGYYNFNSTFLVFEADTNQVEQNKFQLYLRLKKGVPPESILPYEVRSIKVFPNYTIDDVTVHHDSTMLDSIWYVQEGVFFKPKRLEPYILLKIGKRYHPNDSRLTSNRFSSISTYKYVNISYTHPPILPGDQLGVLDANIYLSPLNKRSLRTEIQAVMQSNNFTGPALAIIYSDRNLFKGGEKFSISANVGYEAQVLNGSNEGLTSTQFGSKMDLIFPRLVLPVDLHDRFKYAIPHTRVTLGFEYLHRSSFFKLYSFSSTFGYSWRTSEYLSHSINPVSINYMNIADITPQFQAILDLNAFLNSSFQQPFIAGMNYQFLYNQLNNTKKVNALLLKVNLDVAGNSINYLTGNKQEKSKKVLGLEYAQYAKIEMDLQNHLRLNESNTLIARVYAGVGHAYGNSVSIPYSKQFFSGGPYSVRAFRIRSLGPGTYTVPDQDASTYYNQSGDIRLEANLEYRFPIVSFLKGAVFMDAGNIWLVRADDIPGGQFTSSFMSELAVGAGVGMRVDVQGFVIRVDMATPLKKPLPDGKTFSFDHKQSILNFAIGYPF